MRRRNPVKAAGALSEAFHGRPAHTVTEVVEQLKEHGVLADLGGMEELGIVDPENSKYEIPIKFGHDTRLCSSEDGLQLYLIGGKQYISDLKQFGVTQEKDSVVLGEAASITYATAKEHLGKEDRTEGPYRHAFGEEGGEKPIVVYDCLNHRISLHGGSYRIDLDMDGGTHSAGIRD